MQKIRCKCPGCQTVLQFEANRAQNLRMTCPRCSRNFIVPASQPLAATTEHSSSTVGPGDGNELDDLFAHLPSQPPIGFPNATPTNFAASDPRFASAYAPPRARKKLSAKAKKQLVATAVIAVGALSILVAVLWVAVPLVQKAGVAGWFKSQGGASVGLLNFDSPQAVIRDLESECRRLEDIGRAIPEGDQSEAAAKPLLDGRPALVALLRRACRLPSVRVDLADCKPESLGQIVAQPPAGVGTDPDKWFWQIQIGNKREEAVTDAINQLTSLRGTVYSLVASGIVELPSPLKAKAEQFNWTDEERRILAAVHLVGSFRRDFVRALAAIDSGSVNAQSLKPLHEVVDQYAQAARELAETSRQMLEKAGLPSHRMFVDAPKRTPYHVQAQSIYAALLSLQQIEFEGCKDDPEFGFVMKECKQLSEDIDELMFGSNPRALFASEQSSLERYQELAAKRQAEADRLAEVAAKEARDAQEKQRVAEQRRLEEERKRQQAQAEQAAAANSQPASPAAADDDNQPGPEDLAGPRGRRRPFGFPRPSPGMGGGTAFGPPSAQTAPTASPPPRPSVNVPADPQSTITIKIRSDDRFDSNSIVKTLAKQTGVKTYQSSQSNNQATMRFTTQADLKTFVDAIDFGTVESVDEPSRTISVTIP